jgi:prepilin-type N-terminal cleavage/methylation domain-containing protein
MSKAFVASMCLALSPARECSLRSRARVAGFTLIELVITLVLLGIVALAIVPVVVNTMRADVLYSNKAAAKDALRYAAERLALEIGAMRYDQATNKFSIQAVSESAVTFTRPVLSVQSGSFVEGSTSVRICDTGSSVLLSYSSAISGCSGEILIDRLGSESAQVAAFSLIWKDASGNRLSPAVTNFSGLVRKVDLVISVELDPDGAGQSFETIKRTVDLTTRI